MNKYIPLPTRAAFRRVYLKWSRVPLFVQLACGGVVYLALTLAEMATISLQSRASFLFNLCCGAFALLLAALARFRQAAR